MAVIAEAMARGEATLARIMEAARSEFAQYGFAGARVDRIARAARCNKQGIYAHVGDKATLWRAVYAAAVVETVGAVPFDGRRLPEYAGQLFDYFDDHPEVLRISYWHSLESKEPLDVIAEATARKLASIEDAQAEGIVTSAIPAPALLALILQLCNVGQNASERTVLGINRADFRAALVESIDRLLRP